MFALMLPGLLLLMALALEIGNWYEHRRHLQLQTDAGVLAAGQLFRQCATGADASTLDGPVLGDMTKLAAQYGGDEVTLNAVNPSAVLLNAQVGSNGPAAGNVGAFSYQGIAYPPDYTPVANTGPCTSGVFDIHATEDSIAHIFAISPLATVHAHSRVEMKAINELKGLLPLAVPDVRPNYVFATFVNESTGAVLGTMELTKGLVVNNKQTWIPKNGPIAVTFPAAGAKSGSESGSSAVRIRTLHAARFTRSATTRPRQLWASSTSATGTRARRRRRSRTRGSSPGRACPTRTSRPRTAPPVWRRG